MQTIPPRIFPVAFLLCALACSQRNVDKGNTCLRLGDYPGAIDFFGAELQRRPDSYEARLGMGKALLQKSADAQKDTVLWRTALMHIEAARTLAPLENTAAIATLLSEAWAHHARMLLSADDTLGALSSISRSIEYNPESVEPLNLAGIIYFRLGDHHKALALFTRASDIDSTHPHAYFNLGMVHWQGGNIERAHDAWLAALKRAPGDEDILYWFAFAEKTLRERE